MSRPPDTSSPPQRALDDRLNSQNDRLRIRVVPYSPPRLSSDGSAPPSASSRPVSCELTSSPPLPSPNQQHLTEPSEIDVINSSRLNQPVTAGDPTRVSSSSYASSLRSEETPAVEAQAPHDETHGQDPTLTAAYQPDRRSQGSSGAQSVQKSWRSTSPYARSRQVITVHSDKTFSLVPQSSTTAPSNTLTRGSPSFSSTTFASSLGRSSDAFTNDAGSSSPLTPHAHRTSLYSPASSVIAESQPGSPSTPKPTSGPSLSSPWNYTLVGGLRKVPQTPDDQEQAVSRRSATPSPESHLSSLSESGDDNAAAHPESPVSPLLTKKASFRSSQTASTLSDKANYETYGQSSPVGLSEDFYAGPSAGPDLDSLPPSSSHSNYQVLGESSSSNQSVTEDRPPTNESDANYIVHEGSSVPPSPLVSNTAALRPQFSQESLVVAPLRPVKKTSRESFSIIKSCSRESFRKASLTSLSSVLAQEATRNLFTGVASIHVPADLSRQNVTSLSSGGPLRSSQIIPAYPHQWSSQLSTVFSESEGESSAASRSASPQSGSARWSSGFDSIQARQGFRAVTANSGSHEYPDGSSNTDYRREMADIPQPAIIRNNGRDIGSVNQRMIRDHDEDGDGLADLQQSSRPWMTSYLTNMPSDRSLRSAGSSRANSLKYSNIPVWARLYYGSGERRFLLTRPSSESMLTEYNDSRPGSSVLNRSPSIDRFASAIFSPRRRPRETAPQTRPGTRQSDDDSVEIHPAPVPAPADTTHRPIKKQTSSLWSPHLQQDKRASGFSMWEPPSAVWSSDAGLSSRRNAQVVLFFMGFILPFAWMFAAFLPLPDSPQIDMAERLRSTSHVDLSNNPLQHFNATQESRFHGARWWRALNRGMSIFGLVLISAAIALIVIGTKQQWAK